MESHGVTNMSRACIGRELEDGTRRRLYSKDVAGRGPGPRRRAGAMAEAHGAPRRQAPRTNLRYNPDVLN